jgi:hypothetical protein
MSTYYFPITNELAEGILKAGIPLPKAPQPPMIHALRTVDGATSLAMLFYGSEYTILQIEGDFPLYDQVPDQLSSTVFLTSPVPASALSRVARLRNMQETGRGVAREEGVVSQRTYEDMYGRRFQLRKHLDERRPFSSVGPIHGDETGYPLRFAPIDARSWPNAEAALDDAVGDNIAALRDLPVIVVQEPRPHGDPELPPSHFAQRGLADVNVDVWYVDQDRIDRGSWGSWIEEAGWYWQRMDVAEVHGPFEGADEAVADVGVNFEEPGRPPKLSDESYYVGIQSA